MERFFARFATTAADVLGHAYVFILALLLVLLWALSGPFFGFSDTWQLIVNTATTITTGLMVFIIQNTQNRDARAIHIKLDELLRVMQGARGDLADVEDLSEDDLKKLKQRMMEDSKREHDGLASGQDEVPATSSVDRLVQDPGRSYPRGAGVAPAQRNR
ncbi:MAG: low affinity iron permease family protein [Dehalococcoidia bacterium]